MYHVSSRKAETADQSENVPSDNPARDSKQHWAHVVIGRCT